MYLSFILLTLAIVLLWWRGHGRSGFINYAWLGMFGLALGVGLYDGQLQWIGLLPIVLFGVVCLIYSRVSAMWRWLPGLVLVGLSLGFGLHLFPGFHPLLIVDNAHLAADSTAYTLRFRLDKPVVGMFILAWLQPLLADLAGWKTMLRQLLPVAVLTLVVVMLLAWVIGYIHPNMKLPGFLGYWLWANLFFTCVAEEALFRGFLQRQFAIVLSRFRYGAVVALVVCGVLFGVAHIAGGMLYVVLTTIAGLGYGWAYLRSQRIEASILLHFTLNTVHIIFFSYPALLR